MELNNYERGSELDTEILFADLPFDLLNESIMNQINNPLSSNEDYMSTITYKCESLKNENIENPEYLKIIDEQSSSFFRVIVEKINDNFNLGIDLTHFDTFDEIQELGEVLYRYFILDYLDNISTFTFNYIIRNKELFYREFGQRTKKDVTTQANKKTVKDKQKLAIYANISSIVEFTLNSEISNDEFISLSKDEEDYESSYILDLIESNKMVGDFVNTYIQTCVYNKYNSLTDIIITNVKDKLSIEYGIIKNN